MHPITTSGDGVSGQDPAPLTPLREDIRLHDGGRNEEGAPTWLLHDPVAATYFHIGWREFEILSRWQRGDRTAIITAIKQATTLNVGPQDIEEMEKFLAANGLIRAHAADVISTSTAMTTRKARNLGLLVSEKLLFRRFPLFRPQRFLEATLPFVEPFFSRGFRYLIGVLFIAALYLVSRQWTAFLESLTEAFTLENMLGIAVLLAIAKSIHELAHAYSAVRYGAKVPVMGVALLLFWPVLYTDTSDSWTLTSRKQRLVIAAAGVFSECAIAIVALFLWSFMEPGAMRNTAAFGATTLLLLSIAFNMNPFMKFDGYFVLSEALRTDNAQARAIAQFQWFLRRHLAGFKLSPPETKKPNAMLIYGAATALYRVFLYGGIALALNLMLFPQIAVPLTALLIGTFILLPSFKEIAMWFQMAREKGGLVRQVRIAAVCVILLSPLFIPWRTTIAFPVVYKAGDTYKIFAPEAAQMASLRIEEGQSVRQGAVLFDLASPELTSKLLTTKLKVSTLDRIIDQHLTGDQQRDEFLVRESELAKARTELSGYQARDARMRVRAPADGFVTFVRDGLRPGMWVNDETDLVQIVAPKAPVAIGYVDERDLSQITRQTQGIIWFDGMPDRTIPVTVTEIFPEAVKQLDEAMLSADLGGPIATRTGDEGERVPERGIYKVALNTQPETGTAELPFRKTRGYARLSTPPRSLATRLFNRIVGLWRREFG